eukprot:NODE_24_length_41419_cov_0.818780.p15 type:complete len:297 gc:universal NODE_24_length_41419_cov_0.818780:9234-8344(-)
MSPCPGIATYQFSFTMGKSCINSVSKDVVKESFDSPTKRFRYDFGGFPDDIWYIIVQKIIEIPTKESLAKIYSLKLSSSRLNQIIDFNFKVKDLKSLFGICCGRNCKKSQWLYMPSVIFKGKLFRYCSECLNCPDKSGLINQSKAAEKYCIPDSLIRKWRYCNDVPFSRCCHSTRGACYMPVDILESLVYSKFSFRQVEERKSARETKRALVTFQKKVVAERLKSLKADKLKNLKLIFKENNIPFPLYSANCVRYFCGWDLEISLEKIVKAEADKIKSGNIESIDSHYLITKYLDL